MVIKHTRNVLHLAITENTALRVVLYVAKNKIDWYNENGLHDQVLKELYPVILNYIVTEQGLSANKRQKDADSNSVIYMDGYRILYRFTARNTQQTLIKSEKSFTFAEQEAIDDQTTEVEQQDQKPTVHTSYRGLSIYPSQLLISVDDELLIGHNTLDSYFTTL
ncbi:hypothetical protein V8B55DRAFT_1478969 [Mucor lusitanicus]|uniref:Uncharacterized protein n=2 Tax=Mucor circinelloides f. lusitanicus TaxID=29924 RepID=A0A168H8F8_MUCCL|nr:hypothetical protein FB192DRAFT_1304284 [Mucor lusitanicus]OAC98492.1 hypothetical protein MUCCIDRAFT_115409 [Mucor lusitanicus CBS 277.49]